MSNPPLMQSRLLDQYGDALSPTISPKEELGRLRAQITNLTTAVVNERLNHRREIRARFDAAQTYHGNMDHWGQADFLSPHLVASYWTRRTLRSRSRYELSENNPYLKGTCLTIVNDFVGSGPKLQITDERIPEARRKIIQKKFTEWFIACRLRQKIWRARLAKIVDGETFLLPYSRPTNRFRYDPVQLDFQVIEADRVTTQYVTPIPAAVNPNIADKNRKIWEIDGIRFDNYENPLEYFVLNFFPGYQGIGDRFNEPQMDLSALMPTAMYGKWFKANYIIHWFRQDRGWLRGIPEATSSLPLCAILRRYTLAVIRNAEVNADITVLLETENPGSTINPFTTDENGNKLVDDPFDLFPIEQGMAMNLPWGYKAKQLEAVPLGVQFDEFVGCMLREITRPILSPYNITSGSSKDSNMASGVLDATIYKGGQRAERLSCEEEVLCRIFYLWWMEAIRIPGHIGTFSDPIWRDQMPQHRWRWDRIGIDHTDPARVAEALKVMHDKRFMTDGDIQDEYFNRDLDTWQEEIAEDDAFRDSLVSTGLEANVNPKEIPPGDGGDSSISSPKKKPAKPAAKKKKASPR